MVRHFAVAGLLTQNSLPKLLYHPSGSGRQHVQAGDANQPSQQKRHQVLHFLYIYLKLFSTQHTNIYGTLHVFQQQRATFYYYYSCLTASFPGQPGTRKVEPIWI